MNKMLVSYKKIVIKKVYSNQMLSKLILINL